MLPLGARAGWQDAILSGNSKAMFFNLLKPMPSFKTYYMHSFIYTLKIILDIKIVNNSGHNNLRIYFSKYTLSTHQWRFWICTSHITTHFENHCLKAKASNGQTQTVGRWFHKRAGKIDRMNELMFLNPDRFISLLIYRPPNWRGKLELWPKTTVVLYWFSLTKTETFKLMSPH